MISTVWWYHHVPWSFGPYAEGDHCPGTVVDEGQDHCSPRAQVLRLDRWFHSRLALDLPADVDLEAGVRRERTFHCPPQVLLRYVKLSDSDDNGRVHMSLRLLTCSQKKLVAHNRSHRSFKFPTNSQQYRRQDKPRCWAACDFERPMSSKFFGHDVGVLGGGMSKTAGKVRWYLSLSSSALSRGETGQADHVFGRLMIQFSSVTLLKVDDFMLLSRPNLLGRYQWIRRQVPF